MKHDRTNLGETLNIKDSKIYRFNPKYNHIKQRWWSNYVTMIRPIYFYGYCPINDISNIDDKMDLNKLKEYITKKIIEDDTSLGENIFLKIGDIKIYRFNPKYNYIKYRWSSNFVTMVLPIYLSDTRNINANKIHYVFSDGI